MNIGNWKTILWLGSVGLLLATMSACKATGGAVDSDPQGQVSSASELEAAPLDAGEKLRVVATTNILGDVVGNVGADRIELLVLMDIGVDPHSYVATPADTAAIHDAHVVFANGLGLEADLAEWFASAGGQAVKVHVSDGLTPRRGEESGEHGNETTQEEHEHEEYDPHVWFDVHNVIHWVETIEGALSALDPSNAEYFQQNADRYTGELEALDAWVIEQIDSIPTANRKLVTNHPAFGYLADRYGLEQLGAVYPVSPSAEPSAQQLAALQDTIREYGVPAVFTESTVNPKLAEQVARDSGIRLVSLYSGSLGPAGSGAETYIRLIRYDVSAIVDALKGSLEGSRP